MAWIIVVIFFIVWYIFWKFINDFTSVKRKNISLGGLKKLFPDFVKYFEENGLEFVEDTGVHLVYKKTLENNPQQGKYLIFNVVSKFGNILQGYLITTNGKKVYGGQIEFRRDIRYDEIDMITRKILNSLAIKESMFYSNNYLKINNKQSPELEFISAIKNKDFNGIKNSIERGMDINKRIDKGLTPLLYAALEGDIKILKYLVEKGADVNAKDNSGNNVLIQSLIENIEKLVDISVGNIHFNASTRKTNREPKY